MESERQTIVFGDQLNGKALGSRLPMRRRDFGIENCGVKNDREERRMAVLGAAYDEISVEML